MVALSVPEEASAHRVLARLTGRASAACRGPHCRTGELESGGSGLPLVSGEWMGQKEPVGFYNRSLERALKILDAFCWEHRELTHSQLAEMLGLPRPTIARLCSTLVRYGYLAKDPESSRYSLGMRLFQQGSVVSYSFSVSAAASRHLTQLHKDTGRTIFLGVLDNDDLLYIDKREDAHNAITFTSTSGTRRPSHWGMCGPMLMAYLPDSEVDRLLLKTPLNAATKNSITDKEEFKAWLRKVREEGFAIDDESTFDGITGFAAPVRDFRGEVVASIGVAQISSVLGPREIDWILGHLLKTTEAVSRELGWEHNSTK